MTTSSALADSGARGRSSDPSSLRYARPDGPAPVRADHENPILAKIPRRAWTFSEYFISTHGARKGLADTAL